ncbi:MAG: hypothetical protein Q7S66_02015 [bacterium]|nr:hypothetical protein [bacterium]
MALGFKEYRCHRCKKLLFKGILVESVIELKCKACQNMNVIESSKFDELLCAVFPCPHRVAVVKKK